MTHLRVTNSAVIRVFANDDRTTLELSDRILLSFTADRSLLVPQLERFGEYMRDTATVNINDDDGMNSTSCMSV